MEQTDLVLGLDFGTDSVRALVVDTRDGRELSTGVHFYPRWQKGMYCDPAKSQFRQHPLDFLEAMEASIRSALKPLLPRTISAIKAIGIDTTGSTPAPVNQEGTPLALLPEFIDDPDAMFILWKDHTAQSEANEINARAHSGKINYTDYSGGQYSPEWFWSKILHVIRKNKLVKEHAFSWVEHCDWIPALLTGVNNALKIKRGRCAAGHKAMWHERFDGWPQQDFLCGLDPALADLRQRLYADTIEADKEIGRLSVEWAEKLGLPAGIVVSAGCLDAHAGAVGAHIQPYTLVKVTGTSTCDMVVVPYEKHKDHLVKGICGQVNGSILPGMLGLEAGQSAFGDVYQWFIHLLSYPYRELEGIENKEIIEKLIDSLNQKASLLPVAVNDMVALDWINGRRTPDVALDLKAAIMGMHLGTDAPAIFKALVEATCFGSRAIVERLEEENIPLQSVMAIGGISKKSSFVMQTLSNVLKKPIHVVKSDQACALGAAILAATAAGIFSSVTEAQKKMASPVDRIYIPEEAKVAVYEQLYIHYSRLGKFIQDLKVV